MQQLGKKGTFPNSFYESSIIVISKPEKDTIKKKRERERERENYRAAILIRLPR